LSSAHHNASQSSAAFLDFLTPVNASRSAATGGHVAAVILPAHGAHDCGKMTPGDGNHINRGTVKKLIEENRLDKLAAAIETCTDDGMLNFNQSLFNLVKQGKVSEKDALSKATTRRRWR